MCYVMSMIFCFKEKWSYELRISDWSSDVCSTDLTAEIFPGQLGGSRPDRDIVSCLRLQMALPVRLHRLMIQIPKVDAGRPQVQEHKQMAQKLVAEQLIEQARAATRLDHFDSDSHREGLDWKSVVAGTSGTVRVERGGTRIIKKKKNK